MNDRLHLVAKASEARAGRLARGLQYMGGMSNTTITSRTEMTTNSWGVDTMYIHADHALTDEKGRKVGGYAAVQVRTAPGPCNIEVQAEGTARFVVTVYAARNGEKYGAIPRSTTYKTLELAIAAAEAGLVKQGKSYAKKYGVNAG